MKYVRMRADTPYCGTEHIEYMEVPDDITEEELNEQCDEMCQANAESFSYLATGWEEDFESEEEEEDYYNDCYSYSGWEFVSEEEYREEVEKEGE